jgi:1-acyl-sn-glycerol-3-phosphate acyltransferase
MRHYLPRYLRKSYGIESHEVAGTDRLAASIAAGHGVVLAPNHCRPCDPMVMGLVADAADTPIHIMAGWHLFMQNRVQRWLLPRIGAFSVYREGTDREALKFAVQSLVDARRPLLLFPEGIVSRTNDQLKHLLDGVAFIARMAAKQKAAATPPGKVVIHPVALRYTFGGDIARALDPVLTTIERRLAWQPANDRPLLERITRIGYALLSLKETEYFGEPQTGTLADRLTRLTDRVLEPLEKEWLKGRKEANIIERVKALRTAILPDMAADKVTVDERARRWRQLADIYFAQQLWSYPPDYFTTNPTPEQLLETVERFEEDLTDVATIHRPMHVKIVVGEAIEVNPSREKGAVRDPLMTTLRERLEAMLAEGRMGTGGGIP